MIDTSEVRRNRGWVDCEAAGLHLFDEDTDPRESERLAWHKAMLLQDIIGDERLRRHCFNDDGSLNLEQICHYGGLRISDARTDGSRRAIICPIDDGGYQFEIHVDPELCDRDWEVAILEAIALSLFYPRNRLMPVFPVWCRSISPEHPKIVLFCETFCRAMMEFEASQRSAC